MVLILLTRCGASESVTSFYWLAPVVIAARATDALDRDIPAKPLFHWARPLQLAIHQQRFIAPLLVAG
jgi:hypothetical protein